MSHPSNIFARDQLFNIFSMKSKGLTIPQNHLFSLEEINGLKKPVCIKIFLSPPGGLRACLQARAVVETGPFFLFFFLFNI